MIRKFEVVKEEYRNYNIEDIQLPTRADIGSAGYDFYSPCDFELQPKELKVIPTDIKAFMQKDEVLLLWIRSSLGIKKKIILANQTGVIDSSYYNNPSNDGNIGIALLNTGNEVYKVNKGDKIMQGVFTKYLITDDDEPINKERLGGIGSTGK